MTIELVAVEDAATREAARDLIAEYLRWICVSDGSVSQATVRRCQPAELIAINESRARRNGLATLLGEMSPRVRAGPNGRLA